MQSTAEKLLVIDVCMEPNRLAEMRGLNEGLDRCQKSLNDYLDSKRRIFPRFYFISTEELLSILGSSRNDCVQEHMIKMFDNIKSLTLVKNALGFNVATAMNSSEGEILKFSQGHLRALCILIWYLEHNINIIVFDSVITDTASLKYVWRDKAAM